MAVCLLCVLAAWAPRVRAQTTVKALPGSACAGQIPGEGKGKGKPLFTEQECAWIQAHPAVTIGTDHSWLPFEFIDSRGYQGLASSYLQAIEHISGLEFNIRQIDSAENKWKALAAHDVDMVAVALDQPDAVGHDLVDLSSPYFVGSLVVVTRGSDPLSYYSAQRFYGKRVAVYRYSPFLDILKRRFPDIIWTPVDDIGDGFDQVFRGNAAAMVALSDNVVPHLKSSHREGLHISGRLTSLPVVISMGVRKDLPILASIIRKSVGSITASDADRMNEQWLDRPSYGPPNGAVVLRYYAVPISVGLLTIGALLLMVYRARVARRLAVINERRKSHFIAVMSHEIRTPLNAVVSSIDLLSRSQLTPQQREFSDVAINASHTLVALLDDVLDISKLSVDRLTLEKSLADVHVLIDSALQLFTAQAAAKHLPLRSEYRGPQNVCLRLDATRVRQIVGNLISNSIKFTEHGEVFVRVQVSGAVGETGTLVIDVIDTGIGIAPARQESVFKPFEQAEDSTSRKYGGTGLGLAICRELAKLMQGTLTLHSQVGRGSTVTLTLPVDIVAQEDIVDAIASPPAGTVPAVPAPQGVRARVLVVEDNPVNLQMLRHQLDALNCESVLVDTGVQGVAAATQQSFDLMLLDCVLPDIDGYEVARRVRAALSTRTDPPYLPIVAISADGGQAHTLRCLDAGMDGVLRKPLALRDLEGQLDLWCAIPTAAPAAMAPPTGMPTVDLMALFIATTQQDLQTLRRFHQAGDIEASAAQAHRIRGAAYAVGESVLAEATLRLEQALREADQNGVQAHLGVIAREMQRLQAP